MPIIEDLFELGLLTEWTEDDPVDRPDLTEVPNFC